MAVIVEDYSPIYVGDTAAKLAPSFQHKDGSVVSLAGLTISMKMQDQYNNPKTCTGTWVIDDVSNGIAHYIYTANDVNTVGIWKLFIKLTDGSGNPVHAFERLLEIRNAP